MMRNTATSAETTATDYVTRLTVLAIAVAVGTISTTVLRRVLDSLARADIIHPSNVRAGYVGSAILVSVGVGWLILRIRDRVLTGVYASAAFTVCLIQLSSLTPPDSMLHFRAGAIGDGLAWMLILGLYVRLLILLFDANQQRMLSRLSTATSHLVGESFLSELVTQLAKLPQVLMAAIAELNPETQQQQIRVCSAAPEMEPPEALRPGSPLANFTPDEHASLRDSHVLQLPLPHSSESSSGTLMLICDRSQQFSRGQLETLQVFASRAAAELGRLQADEKSRQMEARMLHGQKLEGLGVLAGGIAHDFNNLLQAIRSYASAARAQGGQGLNTTIDRISAVVDKGALMCSRLLAYAGRATRQDDVCDINQLVRETTEIVGAACPDASISLALAPDCGNVWGDAAQLNQVLMNLVTNAADAVSSGHGRIRISTSATRIDSSVNCDQLHTVADQNYVWVSVQDNGCGMDSFTIDRIFDPFFSTKAPGRGVGLAAVAGIVRDHRGDIACSSQPGKGTTFMVILPTTTQQAEVAQPEPSAVELSARSLRVLVVDDDELVRNSTQMLLETAHIDVTAVPGGAEALKICRQTAEFDVILMDQTMPGMSGVETYRALRGENIDTPVILMSGFSETDPCSELADVSFLRKPCRRSNLLSAVQQAAAGTTLPATVRPTLRLDRAPQTDIAPPVHRVPQQQTG